MKPYNIDIPVLIIFFNRPDLLEKVFDQVKIARPSKLFLYQDGARNEKDVSGIMQCRIIVEQIDWNCEIHKMYQENNFGCDPSQFISQKWAFTYVDKCIMLEDDDVPSISFFRFCKELLDHYEFDTRISIITGINYEEQSICPYDYFFSSDIAIWGWATWKRVIDKWEEHYDYQQDSYHFKLLKAIMRERNQRTSLIPMFIKNAKTRKAYYESILMSSHFLNNGLSIVPTKNMINNIGLTSESTHFHGNLKTIPKSKRRIFTMKRYEISGPLKHPKYVIENIYYKHNIDKILARTNFFRKGKDIIVSNLLRFIYGNRKAYYKTILKKLKIRK